MSGIKGCTNHGCLVAPLPKGAMGTNAICQCMRNPMTAQRVAQDRLRLIAERDRLRGLLWEWMSTQEGDEPVTPDLLERTDAAMEGEGDE